MRGTKNELFGKLPPIRAVFLAARSANQMFSEEGAIAGAAVGCAVLFFSRHRRFCFGSGIIGGATNFTGNFLYFSRALIAVLDNLGFLSWLHQGGYLSWEDELCKAKKNISFMCAKAPM